jgi:hypothetical protein
MQRRSGKTAISIAALGFGALALLSPVAFVSSAAFAVPPQGRPQVRLPGQPLTPAQPLDLRAPSQTLEAGSAADKSSNAFPSRRQNPASPARLELAGLGSDGMRARPTIQDVVHRAHREGLPVARLFETKGALVHLGLSPKGKPGLWLVQKTH